MRKHLLIVIAVALAFFLIGTMFSSDYLVSSAKPPSVWDAINELQAKVNSLSNTVIEQQAQISDLQNRAGTIEEKQTQTRWMRFYEPDETMVDQYVWKNVAVFVWVPRDASNNVILIGRSYFQYLTPTHGLAYRILVNGFEISYNTVPEQIEYQQSVAFLITESPKPNQSTYTITFQCLSTGPSYVKDINIIMEVMDGLPASE